MGCKPKGIDSHGYWITQSSVWMSGHGKAYDLAAAVVEDEEHVQRGEVERGDCEGIDGPGYVHVIPPKRQPCRRSLMQFSGFVHVLADGVRTGRVVPQEDEGVVDPLGTPEGIVLAELMNQALHLPGNLLQDFHRQKCWKALVCHFLTVAGCVRWARSSHRSRHFERTTQSSRKPRVNRGRGRFFDTIARLQAASRLSVAKTLTAGTALGETIPQRRIMAPRATSPTLPSTRRTFVSRLLMAFRPGG